MLASDKLLSWLFQHHAERIQPLVAEWLPRMESDVFSAPVPILAAQMAADP